MDGFKRVFIERRQAVFDSDIGFLNLWRKGPFDLVYVETASNRLLLKDALRLFLLRWRSRLLIIFIRDVYVDFFPSRYKRFRGRITASINRISHYVYVFIGQILVFPTEGMGRFFYNSINIRPRLFGALPPGIRSDDPILGVPDFNSKPGVLYLGGVGYVNSGFQSFIDFCKAYATTYTWFVLSKEKEVFNWLGSEGLLDVVVIDTVKREELGAFIWQNNIAFGFHGRPRNTYDDLTYPIKVMDFLSLGLPFVSNRHLPLENLFGVDYPLFVKVENHDEVAGLLERYWEAGRYEQLQGFLRKVADNQSYEQRYEQLLALKSSLYAQKKRPE